MKASWNGYLSIGSLSIPVRLYAATRSITPRFVRLHMKDHSPVDRLMRCQKDSEEISPDDTVRAVESSLGNYIEITESEAQGATAIIKNILVRQFSDPQAIDPIYYDKPYYLVSGKGGELAYALLREAFGRANKIAVVTFISYEKEHIGIVRPHNGVLILHQLRFAAEIVPRSEIKTPSLSHPTPEQLELARKLMEQYSAPFYIEDYRNEQLEGLQELIERKAKGLRPKRTPRITPQTTPEDQLDQILHTLLGDKAKHSLRNSE